MRAKTSIKRVVALAGVLLIIMLMASAAFAEEFAKPDEFLEKMARGISDRLLESANDESNMTKEEKAEHYQKLVELELTQVEEYADVSFADKNFNELAHMYIAACRMQQCAAKNYKNENLYNFLWDGGRTARAAIIVEMYERYDLEITEEQVNEYRK